MAHVLTHPKTGRTVSVTDKHAEFYTDNGWVKAETAGTKKESADGSGNDVGKPAARKAAKAS